MRWKGVGCPSRRAWFSDGRRATMEGMQRRRLKAQRRIAYPPCIFCVTLDQKLNLSELSSSSIA